MDFDFTDAKMSKGMYAFIKEIFEDDKGKNELRPIKVIFNYFTYTNIFSILLETGLKVLKLVEKK